MLDLRVTVDGDKAVIAGLDKLALTMPRAVKRGLTEAGKAVYGEAQSLLSGPRRKQMKLVRRHKTLTNFNRRNLRGQSDSLAGRPGSYPVPVITGNLRRLLGWVAPGRSKSSNGRTFTADPFSVVIYNSADYADAIHYGKGSSKKYGKRPYLTDGLQRVAGSGRLARLIEVEVDKELRQV